MYFKDHLIQYCNKNKENDVTYIFYFIESYQQLVDFSKKKKKELRECHLKPIAFDV